ncbi:MAG: hypothetical protein AB7I30_19775 [Isosphaeraceae bacterium]
MFRTFRKVGLAMVLLGASSTLIGCESIRQSLGLRTNGTESTIPAEEEEIGVDTPLDVKSARPRAFFQNSRLSGGLSDQAREIERDLGIR